VVVCGRFVKVKFAGPKHYREKPRCNERLKAKDILLTIYFSVLIETYCELNFKFGC